MRRQRLAEGDAVHAEAATEMPLQPCRAEIVADEIRTPEDVAPETREESCVECGLRLGEQRTNGKIERMECGLGVEVVAQEWFWRGGPACPTAKVFGEQATIGAELEPPGALRHRGFDDLVTDHQQRVARTSARMSARDRPIRRT